MRVDRRRYRYRGLPIRQCSRCESWVVVAHDGRVQAHTLDDWALCPGTGQQPLVGAPA